MEELCKCTGCNSCFRLSDIGEQYFWKMCASLGKKQLLAVRCRCGTKVVYEASIHTVLNQSNLVKSVRPYSIIDDFHVVVIDAEMLAEIHADGIYIYGDERFVHTTVK